MKYEEVVKQIKARLRIARAECGLTLFEAGERSRISNGCLGTYEKKCNTVLPSILRLIKLAKVYDKDLVWFFSSQNGGGND